ncbi:multicopper oxidase domain-containing protein [Micromonospora sp. WMMA1363]|uniref:multicopper oxidase family protein n=1 Tax=Micromonospora sp. WMMA1363 TaxID=3053985 RepID=UPI00259CABAA|nr:multicopper oxidase domain-containing protein [Micromonospora sp. WMMA1363]MDM4718172.1 multicopper oxidase domain-containing protein [Micromonospora sp. WMMA1363]
MLASSPQDTPAQASPPAVTTGRRRSTRRRILKAGLIGVPAVLAVGGAGFGIWYAVSDVDTVGRVDFTNPLAIPPLLTGRQEGGRQVFDLTASGGERQFRPGRATRTWGFDNGHLGPTLRARRGETVLVNVRNGLPETTTVHWHGMHLPAAMDGGPHQPIRPGATWSPSWTIDQPAATLWYHPHPHGRTARHVYRGMVGMFIVDDPAASAARLPTRYGVDDIPVIVQDKNFDRHNQLDDGYSRIADVGILGDTVLVNGTVGPYHEVTTERIRLRLLNASPSRSYHFGLSDDRSFALVGTDGGLLPAPYATGRVQLSPGERAEIVVTMRPGERLVLRSYPPELGLDPLNSRITGGDDRLDVLELRAADRLSPAPEPAATLADPPRLGVDAATPVTRRFELAGTSQINGLTMDMGRIDFGVTRGTTEVWEVISPFPKPHNFHVHGTQFQVLSVNGAPPPPELGGWKDTIYATPEVPMRLALRFPEHTDRNLPFMYHCHVLLHEDKGMMGQFVVTEPGQTPGSPPHTDHN